MMGPKSKKNGKKSIITQAELIKEGEDIVIHSTIQIGLTNCLFFDNKKMVSPKTPHQEQFLNLLKNREMKILIVCGPAGTGKTLFSTQQGIKNFMLGIYEKLIFTRPSVSVDENLGFLPGTLEEKMAPWTRPIYDILHQFIVPKDVEKLIEDKRIEIVPLGFMRGRTFKNSWIVADEMQNCTIEQMKMLMTRLGENSRIIITGDLEQSDLHRRQNGLEHFLNVFNVNREQRQGSGRSSSIGCFEFDPRDIQREEVVKEVLEIYGFDNYTAINETLSKI